MPNILDNISGKEKSKFTLIFLYVIPASLIVGTVSGMTTTLLTDVTGSVYAPIAVIAVAVVWMAGGFWISK